MSLLTLLLTTLGFLIIGIPAIGFPVLSWAVWRLENPAPVRTEGE